MPVRGERIGTHVWHSRGGKGGGIKAALPGGFREVARIPGFSETLRREPGLRNIAGKKNSPPKGGARDRSPPPRRTLEKKPLGTE